MYEKLDGQKRTNYCGEFTESQLGQKVVAMGWVAKRRDFMTTILYICGKFET